jgi:hypothetical protein
MSAETPDDPFVDEEEEAAAAEAGHIGGDRPEYYDDDEESRRPLEEAGEGEAEGFEIAERELEENATHGEGRGDPVRDAFTPEVEADEATALDAEADRILEADEDRRDDE